MVTTRQFASSCALATSSTPIMSDKSCSYADLTSEDDYDLTLHVVSVFIVFVVSAAGTMLPVISTKVPYFSTKSPLIMEWLMTFGFSVVIATGFVHMANDGVEMLSDPCVGSVVESYGSLGMAIVLATIVLMYLIECESSVFFASKANQHGHQHHHFHAHRHTRITVNVPDSGNNSDTPNADNVIVDSKIAVSEGTDVDNHYTRKLAVIIFELGVVFHSVIVGVDLGVTSGVEFKTLFAAMCFHQFFEGIAVSGSALGALSSFKSVLLVNVAYAATMPLGFVIGIAVRSSYSSTSVTALWVQGVLNCVAGGILVYTGVVELLTHHMTTNSEFLARSRKERFLLYGTCWLGAGAMALISRWA